MARLRPQNRFWRGTRRLFRWFRIAVLLLILAALVAAIWLNRVGLPQFLKERLTAELHARGVDLQFTRMRLHWYRGLVADNVRLGRPAETNAPRLSAVEAELLIDGRALLQRQFHLAGVGLRGGRMTLPVWGTNESPRELVVDKISGQLRFFQSDEWELVGFRAQSFGVKLLFGGSVSNATALTKLNLGRTSPGQKSAAAFWSDFIAKLERSEFESPAQIIGTVHGDAAEPSSFRASLSISSPRIVSPWGRGTNVSASVQLAPSKSGFEAEVKIDASDAMTKWGRAASLKIEAHLTPSFTRWTPTNAHISVALKQARTPWANAGNLAFVADFAPNPANDAASLAHYTLGAQQVESKWVKSARLTLASDAVLNASNLWPSSATAKLGFAGGEISLGRAAGGTVEGSVDLPLFETMEFANTNLSWRTRLERVGGGVVVRLDNVRSPRLELALVSFGADWHAPDLSLRDIQAKLYDGELAGRATLDTQTRRLTATANTTVDPHKVKSLLDTNTQKWLAQFTWEKPPVLRATAGMTLPSWTNEARVLSQIDWDKEVMPTLAISGDFEAGAATFQSVPVTSAHSSFTFSNSMWRLPDLVAIRPEGRALIAHTGDSRTHEFTFDIDSNIDPTALRPVLTSLEREWLDTLIFTNMPHVRIKLAGVSHVPKKTSFHAQFAATNLSFRSLAVKEVRTVLTLTNEVLDFIQPVVVRTEGSGHADAVRLDLPRQLLFLDNATGSLDPWAVTHGVGPDVEEAMAPYHFVNAPESRAYGVLGLQDDAATDLHFDLAGGPFEWQWFRFQQITGHVHWLANTVTLSNVSGSLNGGHLEGNAGFNFAPKSGCEFAFRTLFNDLNLHTLIADLQHKANKVEGTLHGVLVITNANVNDPKSWQGRGRLAVNEGLLWDFPAFGLFSPVLNAVVPGAGTSRAKEVAATFAITNSVIYSSDLTVHSSGNMRLKFDGTVDFDTRMNGRMIAQMFRDTPGVGGLLATVLSPFTKLFEYKISGNLEHPVATTKYIPKMFGAPWLHPSRTSRESAEDKDKPPAE